MRVAYLGSQQDQVPLIFRWKHFLAIHVGVLLALTMSYTGNQHGVARILVLTSLRDDRVSTYYCFCPLFGDEPAHEHNVPPPNGLGQYRMPKLIMNVHTPH